MALGGYSQYTFTNYKFLPLGNWLERGSHLEFQWSPVAATWFLRNARVEDTLYRSKAGDLVDFDLSAPVFWCIYLTISESNNSEAELLQIEHNSLEFNALL